MRYHVVPLLHCPVASADPIHFGAGDSASQEYRFDLLQDVADQGHHMLTSGASMSLEWPVAPIAGSDQSSPASSHEDPNDEHPDGALPAPSYSRLEAGCSETTSGTAGYCRSGYMWSLLRRRSTMYHLEHKGSHCVGSFLAEKQGAQAQIFREAH